MSTDTLVQAFGWFGCSCGCGISSSDQSIQIEILVPLFMDGIRLRNYGTVKLIKKIHRLVVTKIQITMVKPYKHTRLHVGIS